MMHYHTDMIWNALAENGKFHLNPKGASDELAPIQLDELKAQLYSEAREEGVRLSITPFGECVGIYLRRRSQG